MFSSVEGILQPIKLKFCHCLIILMMFQTCMMLFYQWNTKEEIFNDIHAVLSHEPHQ